MSDTSIVKLSNPPAIHTPIGYSHVAEVTKGKLVYIAGQVALDADGNLVGKDDFAAQARQVFANLKAALESAGASFHDVIKLNYYCADSVDPAVHLPMVRQVRDALVNTAAPPVSTFVVVRRLVRQEWLIEVEAVAVVRDASS
jgi:enamine deaminase RidA (YjgF/YER057c/UK114 family)